MRVRFNMDMQTLSRRAYDRARQRSCRGYVAPAATQPCAGCFCTLLFSQLVSRDRACARGSVVGRRCRPTYLRLMTQAARVHPRAARWRAGSTSTMVLRCRMSASQVVSNSRRTARSRFPAGCHASNRQRA